MLTRKKYYYLLPFLSLLFLVACSNSDNTAKTSNQTDDTSQTELNTNISPAITQQLAVDPHKCIGCGKCVRFDAEHFLLVSGISTVISQDNLDSKNLATAISLCPENAIELS